MWSSFEELLIVEIVILVPTVSDISRSGAEIKRWKTEDKWSEKNKLGRKKEPFIPQSGHMPKALAKIGRNEY